MADWKKTFANHKIREGKALKTKTVYMAADGGTIKNQGEVSVVHRTSEGHKVDFVFQHGDVPIPICSIRRMAHRGCEAQFWKGGVRILFASGIQIPRVERWGVYFMELDIQPPDDPDRADFPRREP